MQAKISVSAGLGVKNFPLGLKSMVSVSVWVVVWKVCSHLTSLPSSGDVVFALRRRYRLTESCTHSRSRSCSNAQQVIFAFGPLTLAAYYIRLSVCLSRRSAAVMYSWFAAARARAAELSSMQPALRHIDLLRTGCRHSELGRIVVKWPC